MNLRQLCACLMPPDAPPPNFFMGLAAILVEPLLILPSPSPPPKKKFQNCTFYLHSRIGDNKNKWPNAVAKYR
jgi:hypothetical protein